VVVADVRQQAARQAPALHQLRLAQAGLGADTRQPAGEWAGGGMCTLSAACQQGCGVCSAHCHLDCLLSSKAHYCILQAQAWREQGQGHSNAREVSLRPGHWCQQPTCAATSSAPAAPGTQRAVQAASPAAAWTSWPAGAPPGTGPGTARSRLRGGGSRQEGVSEADGHAGSV
jgi:hypothetical protein